MMSSPDGFVRLMASRHLDECAEPEVPGSGLAAASGSGRRTSQGVGRSRALPYLPRLPLLCSDGDARLRGTAPSGRGVPFVLVGRLDIPRGFYSRLTISPGIPHAGRLLSSTSTRVQLGRVHANFGTRIRQSSMAVDPSPRRSRLVIRFGPRATWLGSVMTRTPPSWESTLERAGIIFGHAIGMADRVLTYRGTTQRFAGGFSEAETTDLIRALEVDSWLTRPSASGEEQPWPPGCSATPLAFHRHRHSRRPADRHRSAGPFRRLLVGFFGAWLTFWNLASLGAAFGWVPIAPGEVATGWGLWAELAVRERDGLAAVPVASRGASGYPDRRPGPDDPPRGPRVWPDEPLRPRRASETSARPPRAWRSGSSVAFDVEGHAQDASAHLPPGGGGRTVWSGRSRPGSRSPTIKGQRTDPT